MIEPYCRKIDLCGDVSHLFITYVTLHAHKVFCLHIYTYKYTYVQTCAHVCKCACIHVYKYINIHVHVYICIIYIYAYIYTCARVCAPAYICRCRFYIRLFRRLYKAMTHIYICPDIYNKIIYAAACVRDSQCNLLLIVKTSQPPVRQQDDGRMSKPNTSLA